MSNATHTIRCNSETIRIHVDENRVVALDDEQCHDCGVPLSEGGLRHGQWPMVACSNCGSEFRATPVRGA